MTDNLHILYFSFEDDIAKVIESLDSNKAHDHNSISIIYPALHDLVHLYNFKNVENAHGGVLLFVKLQRY